MQGCRNGGGSVPPAFLTRGAVLSLAFHWDSNEVKRLLCSVSKISVVSDSLSFSAFIPALVELDSSF